MAGKNGGKRKGAGRKPKIEEIELIEKLSPMEDEALEALHEGVKKGDLRFVKLYMEYMYGKPKERKELHISGEDLIFNQISFFDTEEE